MLLSFSVQNFLSFRSAQTLDLTADARRRESLELNTFATGCPLLWEDIKN